jgi:hypothetical protein
LALGGLGAALAKTIAGTVASKAIPAAGKAIWNAYKRPTAATLASRKRQQEVAENRKRSFHLRHRRFKGRRP